MVWLDNFSKFYAMAMQGIKGAVAECLWTAHGLHRCVRPTVSTAVAGLRGMPQSLFSADMRTSFENKMATADAVSVSYLKNSVSLKCKCASRSSRMWTRRPTLFLPVCYVSLVMECAISFL